MQGPVPELLCRSIPVRALIAASRKGRERQVPIPIAASVLALLESSSLQPLTSTWSDMVSYEVYLLIFVASLGSVRHCVGVTRCLDIGGLGTLRMPCVGEAWHW